MQVPFVNLQAQYKSIKSKIDAAINDVIEDGQFIGGQRVKTFEDNFADYHGAKYCVGVANGSDALEIALESLGIGYGDEVIVPAMSWMATSAAVSRVGGTPVFADIDNRHCTIDPGEIRKKISSKTSAIIPVHLYGRPADMESIMILAEEYNLKVIEDCAQAHGAHVNNRPVGTFGAVNTFSFYPIKNLGAYGDAGCITSSDMELAKKCRSISDYGRISHREHVSEGRNSRLDPIQAAILGVKLQSLDEWNDKRKNIAAFYLENLRDLKLELPAWSKGHVFHQFVIQVEDRDAIKRKLQSLGIETMVHYPWSLPQTSPYVDRVDASDFPVANKLAERCLSIPIYPELKKEQMGYVVECLRNELG